MTQEATECLVILEKQHDDKQRDDKQRVLEKKRDDRKRLTVDDLRERAQCRACFATWPRSSLDWSKKNKVCIGTNDSWGQWHTFTNFVKCEDCGEVAVGDESVITE